MSNEKLIANLSPEEKRAMLAALLRKKAGDAEASYPLSLGQRALWFLHRLSPESTAYNEVFSWRLRAHVDAAALQEAFQVLVERHPALRTTFGTRDGQPFQQIHERQVLRVERVDATAWSREALDRRLAAHAYQPFDLEKGPLLRVSLFTRSETEHLLLLTVHHLAIDFWSLIVLMEELALLYPALRAGEALALPPPAASYRDYVRWEADMLDGQEGARHWAYWQKQLAGALPVLSLPTDRPRPPVQTYRGASLHATLGEDLTRRLKALARSAETTLYVTVLAAFQALLYRYTGQEDLLVGSPMTGRSRPEFDRIVGFFINSVVLRADLSGDPTFEAFLAQMRGTVLEAIEHQDYPFPLLVERLHPARDSSRSPIFQVLFMWEKPPQHVEAASVFGRNGDAAARPVFEPYPLEHRAAKFDLSLMVLEAGETLTLTLEYNTDLFEAATIARMATHFETLLAGIVEEPAQRVSRLPLLAEAERHRVLVANNDTRADYPEAATIQQLFEAQAARTPDAVAVVFEDTALSYRDLDRRANQLAHHLRAMDADAAAPVGICVERSLEMVVGLLGVMKAGRAYVPLDPSYPAERVQFMLADAAVAVLLTQAHLLDLLPAHDAEVVCLDADWETIAQAPAERPDGGAHPVDPAYVIYTSGSTGQPKGVQIPHRALTNFLCTMQRQPGLSAQDVLLSVTTLSFDIAALEIYLPLMTGARVVLVRREVAADGARLAEAFERYGATVMQATPTTWRLLLAAGWQGRDGFKMLCGGEALPPDLATALLDKGAALWNLYGPTETTIWSAVCLVEDAEITIGHPIANTQLYVLDARMQPVPVGVAGELYIGGDGLAYGYRNRPALTAERFVPDPFGAAPGARLYRTGDLVRWLPDGRIAFLGRIDHQVKIHGHRIELGEIEAVLARHPVVQERVVVVREDAPGDKRLVAYLVPHEGAAFTVSDLHGFLKQTLPAYMVPSAFVTLERMPLTPNGKINRKALPAPDTARPDLATAFVAPRTPTEQTLATLSAEVFGIAEVGIHDNFFELGGASIQSLQIVAKAGEAGLTLKPEWFFQYQTIAELAAVADRHQAVEAPAVEAPAALPDPAQDEAVAPEAAGVASTETRQVNTLIESLGVYLPPRVVSTEQILAECKNQLQFPLEQFTGIKARHMAGEDEFSIDLSKKAVADCLARSTHRPEDIELLVCCNISRYDAPGFHCTFEPSTSVRLQAHFGLKNAVVLDISSACTGMFAGINIVDAFIKTGAIQCGMVVSGEYISHLIRTAQLEIKDFMDSRLACLTVGDAGAALILEAAPNDEVGFHELDMYTLGGYSSYCIAKVTDQAHGGAIMFTEAIKQTEVAVTNASRHALNVLARGEWTPESFDHLIMHQTSKTTLGDAMREINSLLGKKICHEGNTINNLAERGNTATTSHFVALMDHIRNERINAGDRVIFGISGSGQTLGTALYTFDDLPDRLRRTDGKTPAMHPLPARNGAAPKPPPRLLRIRIESIGTLPQESREGLDAIALAKAAAARCLDASAYTRSDVGLLIDAGVYRDDFLVEPALASILAGELDMNATTETAQAQKTLAFDVFNGAVGFLNACYVASRMIQAGKFKTAMVVASEIENNTKTYPDRLLGLCETGSALILDASADGKEGFGPFLFQTFPEHLDARATYCDWDGRNAYLAFDNAPDLEARYLDGIAATVGELLRREGLEMAQIKTIFPPQISPAFVAGLRERLGVAADRMVDVTGAGQDLFTSSVPYALEHARARGLVAPGDVGLIISVGAGVQVGCAVYYF